ncbi:MAG: hypothetical protein HZA31_04760 [Opitutae bacterium]|nr:hypothetical protein [Opitutae bacterium]
MPFTPFHFGPGVALYAIAPRQVSFLSFCAANVFIDVEVLYYARTQQLPLHRLCHTFCGATLVLGAILALFLAASKWASTVVLPDLFGWKQLALRPVAIGAALGSYSHIALDSIMHPDLRPWAPFSDANPLYALGSLGTLHGACVITGLVGLIVITVRYVHTSRNQR